MLDTDPLTIPIPRLIICGGKKPVQFPLNRRFITLGRGDKNGIQIHRCCISYHHLEFQQLAAGRFKIVDLNSRNGTTVNGISIGSCELSDGDRIEVGREIAIHYLLQPADAETEFRDNDLQEFQTIDERLKDLADEQLQLRRCLTKKTAEYEKLLDSIVEIKRNPEAAFRRIHGYSPEDDGVILPA